MSSSQHRAIFLILFYLSFCYVAVTAVVGFKLWLGLVFGALFGVVVLSFRLEITTHLTQWLSSLLSFKENTKANFVLFANGECQFNEQITRQISAHSQINLWGYWLVFTKNDSNWHKHFIFKDSLSCQDQARLARVILRVQQSAELVH